MGFFDRFKKDKKQSIEVPVDNRQQVGQLPFEVEYTSTSSGNLQVDFCDKNAEFNKFYDTTRLIVDGQPLNVEGHQVYNCAVSWYGHSDCRILDKETGKFESLRALDYRGILAEIDLDLLLNDPNYCNMVMKGLLDEQRVIRYLENGLNETTNEPSGNYIGGVRKTEKGYGKFFSQIVGQVSHYSEYMKHKREERREIIKALREKELAEKKAKIAKLQSEIDGMER